MHVDCLYNRYEHDPRPADQILDDDFGGDIDDVTGGGCLRILAINDARGIRPQGGQPPWAPAGAAPSSVDRLAVAAGLSVGQFFHHALTDREFFATWITGTDGGWDDDAVGRLADTPRR